MTSFAVMLRRA
ncbi:hypothetical protein BDFB_011151 [Asbolus verrucosus]|uniref:Uncharacterized protein n=1 Tax=Asbolus verrucosus TaxID=1661398 RepID=A0A482WCF6_ASBVE|nr:hypothetical protein BDFB_011151 [Asbolus verrucosus]